MDIAGPAPSRMMLVAGEGGDPITGCLLGGSLVLTAAHGTSGDDILVVAFTSGDRFRGRVEWSDSSTDAALVRIDGSSFGEVPLLMLGEIPSTPGATVRQAEALGFPRYAWRTDVARAQDETARRGPVLTHVVGQVPAFSGMESGEFEFVVSAPSNQKVEGISPWAGMSGAPVWIDGRLIGILNRSDPGGDRLRGVRISHLLKDSLFAGFLTSGSDTESERARPEDVFQATATLRVGAQTADTKDQDETAFSSQAMSRSTREVIARAASLAGSDAVDASMVLLAGLQYAHENHLPGVTSALLSSLSARQPENSDAGELLRRLAAVIGVASDVSLASDTDVISRVDVPPLSLLLKLASHTAELVSHLSQIHLRHLVAAAVLERNPPLRAELLAEMGVSAGELQRILRDAARAEIMGEPIEAWDTLLSTTSPTPSSLAGGISTDRVDPTRGIPSDRDYLDAGIWVSMLAAVIVDSGTPMPLSVGIFGEWGAGKSYFMGLLRSEVRRLSGSDRAPYLRHVVQIGFNAWHYADTNLWASLGDEIFRQLADPREAADEGRQRLREELAKGSAERQALEARKAQARDESLRLATELDEATVRTEYRARDLLNAAKESPEVRRQLDAVWRRLGIREEAQQARMLADQIRGTGEEAKEMRGLLGRRRIWVLAGICVLALLIVAAATWLPVSWGKWLRAGGSTALGLVLITGLTWMTRAREGLSRLRSVAGDLSRGVEVSAKRRTAEAVSGAVKQLRRAEADERVVQTELDELDAHVRQLTRQLTDLMPGQRLYTFLSERAGGGPYVGQLGLISTIRKDFEHLVELLQDWRVNDTDRTAQRPIDRIVLYIDDLDRCSAQQVVDVLQAVHLLLALDLFVVIVGVDPRWLRRSLERHYQGVLDAQTSNEPPEPGLWNVTPNDYLEKIFNIPFVLPGIPAGGLGRMLRGLATPGINDRDKAGGDANTGTAETARLQAAGPQGNGQDGDRGSESPNPGTEIPVEPHSELALNRVGAVEEPPRPLTEPELELLSELEVFVNTPREAKRMFNLYRMLRSTRDLSDASVFLGDDRTPGEYQAVAVLLGMLTASPRLLRHMLEAMPQTQTEPSIAGGLTYRPDTGHWYHFVADFAPKRADSAWLNQIIGRIPPDEVSVWQRFAASAEHTSNLVSLPDLTAFKRWAPRIKRFSFVLSPLDDPSNK
jgi:hypothetical protein